VLIDETVVDPSDIVVARIFRHECRAEALRAERLDLFDAQIAHVSPSTNDAEHPT
jgi:hypothetical protein